MLWLLPPQAALAQSGPPAAQGENFSDKPAPALFASDCTGGGCHKGPQGLAKGKSQGSLASFLREHYTNSRQSAAALAAYLVKIPSAPPPREARAPRTPPSARSSRASAGSDDEPAKPVPRGRRGRQQAVSAAPPPMPPEPPTPPAPEPPPKKQFDIFD